MASNRRIAASKPIAHVGLLAGNSNLRLVLYVVPLLPAVGYVQNPDYAVSPVVEPGNFCERVDGQRV
jgi:hypothetical protein